MRLIDYLAYSGLDEETNKFRAMDIKLVKSDTGCKTTVDKIVEKYQVEENPIQIVNDLNKELRTHYSGLYKFDICLMEGYTVDKLRVRDALRNKFQLLMFKANDKLAKTKKEIERKSKTLAK